MGVSCSEELALIRSQLAELQAANGTFARRGELLERGLSHSWILYPDRWKLSRVIPLHKGGDKDVAENYRPIAIVSAVPKTFETIVHSYLLRKLDRLVGDSQHGFRPSRSTITNLSCLHDFLTSKVNAGLQVDVAYFDYRKPFDQVDNDIILSWLSACGLSPRLLKLLDGMPTILKFINEHSHPLNTAAIMLALKPTSETKLKFEKYFENGLDVAKACSFHQSVLLLDMEESSPQMANAQVNPPSRTVKMWFNEWRSKNLGAGDADGAILKLKENKLKYEKKGHIILIEEQPLKRENSYVYCPLCNLAWKGWDENSYKVHPNHEGDPVTLPGVYVQLDFISENEENALMKGIDEMPWELSQSGRRKQNFGPKTNFKKKRLRIGNFRGFPEFSRFIQDKFQRLPLLKSYQTIEQCSLEYEPNRGASIDPHIDDCWVWGERIVTVNFLSGSVLTMTPFIGDDQKYNLADCSSYNRIVNDEGHYMEKPNLSPFKYCKENNNSNIVIRIPMPRRSLIVLYGEARYSWEHCVLREDIRERRVCLAYREFTPPFLPGGIWENEGSEILDAANSFWNHLYMYKIGS